MRRAVTWLACSIALGITSCYCGPLNYFVALALFDPVQVGFLFPCPCSCSRLFEALRVTRVLGIEGVDGCFGENCVDREATGEPCMLARRWKLDCSMSFSEVVVRRCGDSSSLPFSP